MKVSIKELKPNPNKKDINKGKLCKEQTEKIKSNIEELGLMGSIPVFKKDDQYFLIAGHHRIQALKEIYGKDYEVNVTVHDYNDEQILRGMIVENLTQRADDLMEVSDNLALIRKHLKNNPAPSASEQANRKDMKGVFDAGGINDIYAWLNKNGEVLSKGKICEYLKVYDNLDRTLLKTVEKTAGGSAKEGTLSIEEAKNLSRIERKDQKKMQGVLEETGLDYKEKSKLVTVFNEADEETKQKVLNKEISIFEIGYKPKTQENKIDRTQMSLKFNKRALELVNEMKFLRKTLYQFRKEKLFEQFTPQQRITFHNKLMDVRKEYGTLLEELEKSIEVLK